VTEKNWSSEVLSIRSQSQTNYLISFDTGWWFGTCFIFPYIGNNHPNQYVSEGLKPPTRISLECLDSFSVTASNLKEFDHESWPEFPREVMGFPPQVASLIIGV
jgi:hypothetical protein